MQFLYSEFLTRDDLLPWKNGIGGEACSGVVKEASVLQLAGDNTTARLPMRYPYRAFSQVRQPNFLH